ncbi:MAG: hypothetical protein LBK13_02080 [Spirochaetales bacterium]|jgi:hypothetical protein|nr:hypothetical protein [Spirochaetales bacterium]
MSANKGAVIFFAPIVEQVINCSLFTLMKEDYERREKEIYRKAGEVKGVDEGRIKNLFDVFAFAVKKFRGQGTECVRGLVPGPSANKLCRDLLAATCTVRVSRKIAAAWLYAHNC